MTTKGNWISSLFCAKCFSTEQDGKIGDISNSHTPRRSNKKETKKTVVHPMNPLPSAKGNPTNTDSAEVKTSISATKENTTMCTNETKLNHAETILQTPRYDMELEVLESDYLEMGRKYQVRAQGYVDNVQTKFPKKIHLGTELQEVPPEDSKDFDNDIVCSKYKIGNSAQSAAVTIAGGVFLLEDLGGGDGVYIKAEENLELDNRSIVYYGIGHFAVQILEDLNSSKSRIKLKFIDGKHEGQERTFDCNEVCTLGRSATCAVVFDEYGVSRVQCKIFFENGVWYIVDGDGTKKSTNGTWLLVDDATPIFNKMVFKVCNTVFKAIVVEDQLCE